MRRARAAGSRGIDAVVTAVDAAMPHRHPALSGRPEACGLAGAQLRPGSVRVPEDSTAYDVSISVKDGSQRIEVPTASQSTHHITLSTADGVLTVVPTG